jgi:hypothetical protein
MDFPPQILEPVFKDIHEQIHLFGVQEDIHGDLPSEPCFW